MYLLVGVDNLLEVDSSAVYLLLEHREHPLQTYISMFVSLLVHELAHSGGLAGSMITASLDLSSTTR